MKLGHYYLFKEKDMKYIKNGKLQLDGSMKEYEIQEKINLALETIVDKLRYEIDPFDFLDYETYQDYQLQYYEHQFDDPDGEGYPEWYLTKEQFETLTLLFKGGK